MYDMASIHQQIQQVLLETPYDGAYTNTHENTQTRMHIGNNNARTRKLKRAKRHEL